MGQADNSKKEKSDRIGEKVGNKKLLINGE